MTEDMEDNTKLLESLFEKATDYGKTSLELVKLKTVEKTTDVVTLGEVPAEFIYPKYYHKRGALCAAREGDETNPLKASSGCQFYIVEGQKHPASSLPAKYTAEQKKIYETIGGTPFLDGGYTVYGEITEGLDIIDKIANVEHDQYDRPKKDLKMTIKLID